MNERVKKRLRDGEAPEGRGGFRGEGRGGARGEVKLKSLPR